jgi:hypothetical protein
VVTGQFMHPESTRRSAAGGYAGDVERGHA